MYFNKDNILYRMDEEFRQRVIQQAIMLGFTAEETTNYMRLGNTAPLTRWKFIYDGVGYTGYASVFSAAFEYLRLSKFPEHMIGRVNDGGEVHDTNDI